ncbi:MAG: hypothetical protein Q8N99_02510 [Nanoarchaeota archaeon]|nr:hypothetical protein [Nanoarchaeota archaeon]
MDENKIKRGYNIYLYYWTIFAFVLFWTINYYSNYYVKDFKSEFENIGLMISVLSFLFGFMVNINFSMIMNRMNSLRSDLAAETGRLVNLYNLSKNLGKDFSERIRELIDEYTINTLRDYSNYGVGRSVYYRMSQDLKLMEIKDDLQKMSASSFVSNLGDWEQIRERLEYLTSEKALWSFKFTTYVLGSILIILLFLNRGDIFTNALFIILSTIIVFLFLIIEDYDNLRIGDYQINISNSEQLFDLIEKERYYPEKLVRRVRLERGRVYRIGVYNEKEKQERIFKLTYTPYFGLKLDKAVYRFWRHGENGKNN